MRQREERENQGDRERQRGRERQREVSKIAIRLPVSRKEESLFS